MVIVPGSGIDGLRHAESDTLILNARQKELKVKVIPILNDGVNSRMTCWVFLFLKPSTSRLLFRATSDSTQLHDIMMQHPRSKLPIQRKDAFLPQKESEMRDWRIQVCQPEF